MKKPVAMDRLKRHLSDPSNIALYALLGVAFVLKALDEGVGAATTALAAIGFTVSGMYFTVYALRSLQRGNFSAGWDDLLSGAFFFAYVVWWISERGVTREAILLALPVFVGLIMFLAVLFTSSRAGQAVSAFEARMITGFFSLFRRKR